MPSIAELRERAREHAREIEAVLWMKVADLSARWGLDAETIKMIPREKLPFLEFGERGDRRYDPRDVEAFEAREKKGAA